jgi:hypothetical protein
MALPSWITAKLARHAGEAVSIIFEFETQEQTVEVVRMIDSLRETVEKSRAVLHASSPVRELKAVPEKDRSRLITWARSLPPTG